MNLTAANHPRTCTGCDGTGWQPGPPIPAIANGQDFNYTTVTPCTHIWWDDDPNQPTIPVTDAIGRRLEQ